MLVKWKKADTDQVNEEDVEELLANARAAVARGNALLTIEEARAEPVQELANIKWSHTRCPHCFVNCGGVFYLFIVLDIN